jgi:hypothetical protein
VISLVLALGAGLGMAAIREVTDTSVKSAEEFTTLTGIPVLAAISRIVSPHEIKARRIKWAAGLVGASLILCAALITVDQFVTPLEVLWARAERKIMKITSF